MDLAGYSAELVRRAREASSAVAFRREILALYRRVVRYDSAVLTDYGGGAPLVTVNVDDGSREIIRYCEQNLRRYAREVQRCFDALLRTGGFLDSEMFSARERRELPFYCEVVRPQGVTSTIALAPRWRGVMLGMIRLQRGRGTPFSRRDLARAAALLPTVELSLKALGAPALPHDGAGGGGLSARELEVARQVGRGLTTRQIALLLGTSPLTVRNQISHIFDKVRVASRAELAAWVARQ